MHASRRTTVLAVGCLLGGCSQILGLTDPRVEDTVAEGGTPPAEAGSDAPVDSGADADAGFAPPKSCIVGECTPAVTNLLSRKCDSQTTCNFVEGVAVQGTTLFWSLVDSNSGHSVVESCALPSCPSITTYTTGGSGFVNVDAVAATSTRVLWTERGAGSMYDGLYAIALSAVCPESTANTTPPCRISQPTLAQPLGVAATDDTTTWIADTTAGLQRCAPDCAPTGVLLARAVALAGSNVYSATDSVISKCNDAMCTSTTHIADVVSLEMLAADGDDLYWTSALSGDDASLFTCKASSCASTMHPFAVHMGSAWGVAVDATNVYVGTSQAMGTIYAIAR